MNPIQGNILFSLIKQANVRVWYYDTATDEICYVAEDGSTEEAIPFDEHMAMKHPDDCPQVYSSLEYMMKERKPLPDQLVIRYRDINEPDGYRYTLNTIFPYFEGDTIHVIGSEQNITAMVRKQQLADEQVHLIEKFVQHREDTWTINRSKGTIHIHRVDGTEIEQTLESLIQSFDETECMDGIKAIENLLNGETKIQEFYLKEKEKRSDGKRHSLQCMSMPSKYDYHGNVLEYMGVGKDITQEVSDKRKLNQALAKAREQSQQKSVFVARASHDLRNPLNVLLTLSDMMCMDMPAEERKELNEMMKQSGESLLLLINDILDLSRIDSGIQFTMEEFDIAGLVQDVIQSFQISSGKRHNISFEPEVTKPIVKSDSKRLVQIVNNYLSNAIKYSPEGSDILVSLRSNEEELYLAVKDHGCGIAKSDQSRVFSEFARFNTEVNGTGLGLSICKRIAEGLGGQVGFESEQNAGSTFWVRFKA